MIEDERTEIERIGRIWITFALLGGMIGALVFFGLHFGLCQPEMISTVLGTSSGLIVGFGGAQLKWTRAIAAKATDALYFLRWLTK